MSFVFGPGTQVSGSSNSQAVAIPKIGGSTESVPVSQTVLLSGVTRTSYVSLDGSSTGSATVNDLPILEGESHFVTAKGRAWLNVSAGSTTSTLNITPVEMRR